MNKKPILNIRSLRKRRGLKQYEFATIIGVAQGVLSDYERGEKLPGVERLPTIAAALGVDINDLFAVDETADHPNSIQLAPIPA